MRARLVFGLIAAVVVTGLVAWGFVPGGAGKPTAASRPLPSQSAHPVVSPSPSGTAGTGPPNQGVGWRLMLDASFSGSRLDTALWAQCYPWMDVATGCTNFTNAQLGREWEWYLPSQVRVRNGSLQLVAQRTPTPGRNSHGGPHVYACRSGMVTTYPGFRFEYGYVQIVAHVPPGAGLWPALWLAASNLRWPPEIDILEHWGAPANRTAEFFHPLGAPALGDRFKMPTLSTGWHTFALLWSPYELIWYIDGHQVLTTHLDIPQQSMYFIANVAEATRPTPGSGCEGTMSIRSVQVWQQGH
jgi:hypothetical protein